MCSFHHLRAARTPAAAVGPRVDTLNKKFAKSSGDGCNGDSEVRCWLCHFVHLRRAESLALSPSAKGNIMRSTNVLRVCTSMSVLASSHLLPKAPTSMYISHTSCMRTGSIAVGEGVGGVVEA